MNTRIFYVENFVPNQGKNHDLPPVGFSHSTITGKIGYNETHPVTSNSHTNVQHPWTQTHILVSPRLGQITHSQKNEFFFLTTTLLAQANVRTNKALKFCQDFE